MNPVHTTPSDFLLIELELLCLISQIRKSASHCASYHEFMSDKFKCKIALGRRVDIISTLRVHFESWQLCYRPCSPMKVNRGFGGTFRLHPQGWKVSPARNEQAEQMACRKDKGTRKPTSQFPSVLWEPRWTRRRELLPCKGPFVQIREHGGENP
jgi:hypothetical protein